MRNYSKLDMLRFLKFCKENQHLKAFELIKAYDMKYPELSPEEKIKNLFNALGGLTKPTNK
jgi:hypothetical protein